MADPKKNIIEIPPSNGGQEIKKKCPFMSGVQIVPGGPPGRITPAGAMNFQVINTQANCIEDLCPMWRAQTKECSFHFIAAALGHIVAEMDAEVQKEKK